ncbi:MAG: hypothetical protein KDJ17_05630 [Hyphomicrobiaceae bacterium]|nr:hypothetical protein [Hyphomicrobiaceae bacterium]
MTLFQRSVLSRISAVGAVLFAIVVASQPVLDAAGKDEIYIRAVLLPVLMLLVGWPLARVLKRLRTNS